MKKPSLTKVTRLSTRSIARLAFGILAVQLVALLALSQEANAQVQRIAIDDGEVSSVEMAPGRTLTITTDVNFADILIGNTAVIDVFPLTDTSVYIQSKAVGRTNITLYSGEKRLLEVIDVSILTDFDELRDALRTAVPGSRVFVNNLNNRVQLSGTVKDNVDMQRVLEITRQFTDMAVINGVVIESAQQVELDVRIIEVERNAARGFGTNLTGTDGGNTVFSTLTTQGQTAAPFGTIVGNLLEISGIEVDFVINALETKGLARRLANPKLITTSGIEANFVVGGEIPISSTALSEDGIVTGGTSYREYGVRLNFLPTVKNDGLISLRITPEVSDVDFSNLVNGQPSFITRRADTTVSLRNGQSFAIAGLIQANNARNVEQLPWLGQVPILGTLFSSRGFQKRESDLVILVTPRLVQPAVPDQPLATPLDLTRSSNDVELFLLGMLEVDRKVIQGYRDGNGISGPYGHMIDLEFDDAVIKK